jgi:hypothetical protein
MGSACAKRCTPREQRVTLLQFANPVQRGLRRRMRTRTILRGENGLYRMEDT